MNYKCSVAIIETERCKSTLSNRKLPQRLKERSSYGSYKVKFYRQKEIQILHHSKFNTIISVVLDGELCIKSFKIEQLIISRKKTVLESLKLPSMIFSKL